MKAANQGFIFFLTLSLLSMMSLLLLTSMAHVLLYHKIINKLDERNRDFYALEQVVIKLSQSSFDDNSCVVPAIGANKTLSLLLHHARCSLSENNKRYQYIIEDLGVLPCLVTMAKEASHHRRITVGVGREEGGLALMQVRVIQATPAASQCSGMMQTIKPGISSWRYLTDL